MKTLAPIHKIPTAEYKKILPFLPEQDPELSGKRIIPVCEPNFSPREEKYLLQAFRSSWVSSQGKYIKELEHLFAETISNTKYAYAVNSGTTALHTALTALGIGPGDEVIVPTFTMIATINAVMYTGATPVLADAVPDRWTLNPKDVEQKITKKTKAVIAVHIYGLPAELKPLQQLARKHNLWLIEDAAEAQGAACNGKRVGSIGDVAAFSMYANKTTSSGEGGVVTTNNSEIAKRIDLLRRHAFSHERHFWHTMTGFGYRMTNLQAAIGFGQIERFTELTGKKLRNAGWYTKFLNDIPGLTLPATPKGSTNVYWMFGILVDQKIFGISKNQLRRSLAKKGIETRSFFIPMHWQPVLHHRFKGEHYPVSELLCRDGLYLPSSTLLSKTDIEYICKEIRMAGKPRS